MYPFTKTVILAIYTFGLRLQGYRPN